MHLLPLHSRSQQWLCISSVCLGMGCGSCSMDTGAPLSGGTSFTAERHGGVVETPLGWKARALWWHVLLLGEWTVKVSPSLPRNQIMPWPHARLLNQRKHFRIPDPEPGNPDAITSRQVHTRPRGQHWGFPTPVPSGHCFFSLIPFTLRTPIGFSSVSSISIPCLDSLPFPFIPDPCRKPAAPEAPGACATALCAHGDI